MGNSHNLAILRTATTPSHTHLFFPLFFHPLPLPRLIPSQTHLSLSTPTLPPLTHTRSVLGTKEENLAHTKREKAKVSDLLVANIFDKFEHLGLVT